VAQRIKTSHDLIGGDVDDGYGQVADLWAAALTAGTQRFVSRQSTSFSTVLRSYLPSDARTSVWNNVAPAAR